MINLSLKLDVSINKLILVFVGSADCYGVSQFVSGLVRPGPQQNISESPSKGSLSDVGICKENTQGSTAVKRIRTIFGVSGNHRVNNKVVRKILLQPLLAIEIKETKT